MTHHTTTPHAISWSDGPPETAGDDNCLFMSVRLVAIGACALILCARLLRLAWGLR